MTLQSPATINKNEKCYITNYQHFTSVINTKPYRMAHSSCYIFIK